MLRIPLTHTVDVVLAGATSANVAAAGKLARSGHRVLVLACRHYLGDDIAATWDFWRESGDEPTTALAREIYPDASIPTPMRAKMALETELIDSGAEWLLGSYAVDILRDSDGQPAGVVAANCEGFFAIQAKVVVDGTPLGTLARRAGVAFAEPGSGSTTRVRWVTAGEGMDVNQSGYEAHRLEGLRMPGEEEPVALPAVAWERDVAITDWSPSALLELENQFRRDCWRPEQTAAADTISFLPNTRVADDGSPGVEAPFRRCGGRLWVVGGASALPDAERASRLRPCAFMALGEQLGERIGKQLTALPQADIAATTQPAGDETGEALRAGSGGLRLTADVSRIDWTPPAGREIDRSVDVLISGGGTAGGPAGVAATRNGTRTLVVEPLAGFGGVGTHGLIGRYWFGNRVGFTSEVDERVDAMGPGELNPRSGWNTNWKMAWYLNEYSRRGGETWFHSVCCGALVEGDSVRGAAVATPYGFGFVRSKATLDCTGNAALAAAAGAPTVSVGGEQIAMQGSGLGPKRPGVHYRNTDWTFIDDADTLDRTHVSAMARRRFRDDFDLQPNYDTRERRRIRGDLELSPLDFLCDRRYPDTICTAESNFDTHGFTIHPVFFLYPPTKKPLRADIPYRALLPKGYDGLLVTGLGASAHRDVSPVIRMQADVQNTGYAAGMAASMAARDGVSLRRIDLNRLQAHLAEKGNLSSDRASPLDLSAGVAAVPDSPFSLSAEKIRTAANGPLETATEAAILFAHPDQAKGLLEERFTALRKDPPHDDPELLRRIARILGFLGSALPAAWLADFLSGQSWDEGWDYTGMGQFGACRSEVDADLHALAQTGDRASAEPVFLEFLGKLRPEHAFSHFRAIAEGCESLRITSACSALTVLLEDPAIRGQATCSMADAFATNTDNSNETAVRNRALKEIHLARALFHCGDPDGLGERVLNEYAGDLRGLFARHARTVLNENATTAAATRESIDAAAGG